MTTTVAAATQVVKRKRDTRPLAPEHRDVSLRESKAIAARLRQIRESSGLSERAFSKKAGLGGSHFGMVAKRLDEGGDCELGTLRLFAEAGSVTLRWLIEGIGNVQLRDVDGWAEAAALARARNPELPSFAIEQVGQFLVPTRPSRIDDAVVRDLAWAWFRAATPTERVAAEAAEVAKIGPLPKR